MDATSVPEFFNISDLAVRMGVSRKTVYRWMRDGCPHLKHGGITRFVLSEVVEWLRTAEAA